ncbi:ankyrin repeat-containing protein At5g02620-like isoform X2 [Phaseolus vulgaris]|uniref:ankyrin repeat-containing protein At5g02620-like isoform X2 n=1 Tax=Phaseolus vulgaris TaxID=3885 RepID=UPI0035CC08BB
MVSSEGESRMPSEDWYENTEFKEWVLKGRWREVILGYKNYSYYHKIRINESRGTALHMAVNDGKVEVANILVGEILNHEKKEQGRYESALRSTNERGDTPLHLAASRGFIGMCKCIIGEEGERKDLIKVRNKNGETPIFKAVLNCQIKAFVYLHHVSEDLDVTLRDYTGDTILHKSIWREFLDLAIIISRCYPELVKVRNKDGDAPLKVLACKPSAFKSGSNLPWWKQILYYVNIENEGNKAQILVEQKYVTFFRYVKTNVLFALKCLRPSGWGVTTLDVLNLEDLKELKKIKKKHKCSGQLLNILMKAPYLDMEMAGGMPSMKSAREDNKLDSLFLTKEQLDMPYGTSSEQSEQENTRKKVAAKSEENETTFVSVAKAGLVDLVNELQNKVPTALNDSTNLKKENLLVVAMKNIKYKLGEHHVDKKETAFLTAVKNGIVEIVFELQSKIPSVVHETNSNNENVFLVAVKNRQTIVIEKLKKILDKKLFDSLILEVDDMENTVLHLASGTATNTARTWQIAGAAMQMMWDFKWYEYVRALVPEHFTFRINKENKTSREVFKENHEKLLQESSDWMKETSNSCSVVAALVAGVSFATSSSVPGGTNNGKPELEGQPAFDVFAIASLIGLCFSVTALIMFLAILTSRKQFQDFKMSLPLKLLFGLSSLFVSISSMLVSFCAGHFFVLKDKYKNILFPIYIATCLPITFYAVLQFPLYADLLRAIFHKVPQPSTSSSKI